MLLLDLLTINLWGLPWPVARHRVARKRRFRDHVLAVPYDVIGIQELWWPWRRALELDSLLLPHQARRDCGLALAGRASVCGELRVRHFQSHAGPDRLKRKGVLSAGVKLAEGLDVAVHVTHLQAGRRHSTVRERQIAELLDELARSSGPAIVMGDFNFHRNQREDERSCERLAQAGFADVASNDNDAEPTFTSANRYVGRRHRPCAERFDRVFLRDGAGVRLRSQGAEVLSRLPAPFSDHHPLRVRVRLEA